MMRESARKQLAAGTVIPAFPLTLNADRTHNERRQRALIRYYLDAGVGGLAVAVHTTQFEIRKPEIGLFEPVLRIGAEEADAYEKKTGKTIIKIAGCCGPKEQAIKEATLARDLGYDAVLLSCGGLGAYTEDYLIERTEEIAKIMPIVGFYLQPAAGGRLFSYNYWERLVEIDNVVAIKAAPFNRYQTIDVVRAVALSSRADEIAVYTGNDDNIVVDLLTNYRYTDKDGNVREKRILGGLLGHWSMWTKSVVELYNKLAEYRDGRDIPAELLTLNAEVTDCNAAFFDAAHSYAGCIPGVHEVLRRQGLMEGTWCLNPDEELSPGQAEEIDRVYRMYPHLNDDAFVKANLDKWLND